MQYLCVFSLFVIWCQLTPLLQPYGCMLMYVNVEELFIDYGLSYDRSDYGSSDSDSSSSGDSKREALEADVAQLNADIQQELAKLRQKRLKEQEEVDMLSIQPIKSTGSSILDDSLSSLSPSGDSTGSKRSVVIDQDTTRPNDGFISKLKKQDDLYKRKGRQVAVVYCCCSMNNTADVCVHFFIYLFKLSHLSLYERLLTCLCVHGKVPRMMTMTVTRVAAVAY